MELIPCGTEVTMKFGRVDKAVITAIEIRFSLVTYQVSYFNDGELQTCWLNEQLFTAGEHEKIKIGFNK